MQTLIAETVDIRSNIPNVPGGANVQMDLGVIISSFIGFSILIAGIMTLAYMVLGAVRWVSAGGDKGKIEKAQQTITQAIVGLVVTAIVYALFQIVQYFFGISILA